jgi:hypothetical protein
MRKKSRINPGEREKSENTKSGDSWLTKCDLINLHFFAPQNTNREIGNQVPRHFGGTGMWRTGTVTVSWMACQYEVKRLKRRTA